VKISLDEPQCSSSNSVGLNQTVGQSLGTTRSAIIFVVNSTFASDNPGLTASDKDLSSPPAKMRLSPCTSGRRSPQRCGTAGYAIKQKITLRRRSRGTP